MSEQRHYHYKIVFATIGISWGAVCFSYAGSVIGTTLGQPSFYTYMNLNTNPHADALIGSITGLFYAGGVFGCLLNAWMADAVGRKWTCAFAATVLLIASACLAGSVNVAMFIAFRFLAGLGAYMLYLTVPLWVTEIVPPKGRSILAGIVGLAGVVGYIIAAYVGVGFFYWKTTKAAQWRVPIALGCVPCLIFLCLLPWLPESPRWMLSKGKDAAAKAFILSTHTKNQETDHVFAEKEFLQMQKQRDIDNGLDSSWLSMFQRPSYRKRMMIAFCTPLIVYSTGNLVITTYAATIFTGLGYDASSSIEFLAATYVAAIVGNVISLTYVDRIPRNVIFAIGVIAVTVVMSIEIALTATFLTTKSKSGLAAAAGFIFLYLFTFNLFLEGPSWYYASEIFPTHIRAKGMTVAIIGFCLVNLFWLELAPTAESHIGWKYYLVFVCISVPSALIMYFYWPNTLRKPLEEVALIFGDHDLAAVYRDHITLDDSYDTHEADLKDAGSYETHERLDMKSAAPEATPIKPVS